MHIISPALQHIVLCSPPGKQHFYFFEQLYCHAIVGLAPLWEQFPRQAAATAH